MLKKAGIVVATAAAGLLAVSPLAFAGESHKDWGHGHGSTSVSSSDQSTEGLVNVTDTNLNVPVQFCNNDIPVNAGVGAVQTPIREVTAALTGALGVFGKADADTDVTTTDTRGCAQDANTGDAAQS